MRSETINASIEDTADILKRQSHELADEAGKLKSMQVEGERRSGPRV
ncbi:hypothetical protein GTO89_10085 [Heliobacterium gestii]|uniref:Uncharacterized protein n=1 Tax=Heliomicrobium gestii TaxID=2699 RepID=A0A845LFK8_HELGE|nr:hypothetical protein [Heliomicrobium gestii]MBM7868191.1 diacylglycerol kinase [Heliomicrobium gestii]MZP43389.1 hypothetical protein [Heliomicrobium gestii]